MQRYITTLTIVHEVENEAAAKHDSQVIKSEVRKHLVELSTEQKIGSVRAVTLYRGEMMK